MAGRRPSSASRRWQERPLPPNSPPLPPNSSNPLELILVGSFAPGSYSATQKMATPGSTSGGGGSSTRPANGVASSADARFHFQPPQQDRVAGVVYGGSRGRARSWPRSVPVSITAA